ncbi:MAG: CrcB family protein [Actinomycetota bacterium]|nr:CrcB family protein [Actinomycetota bacterium]
MQNPLRSNNNGGSIDPDVDVADALQRAEMSTHAVLATVVLAAGGMVGALARASVDRSWPIARGGPDWATLAVNVVGSLLIGAMMVFAEHRAVPRLVRLFAAPGVLGGFTTFSGFGESTRELVSAGRIALAVSYVAITATSCVLSAAAGIWISRRLSTGIRNIGQLAGRP